MHKSLGGVLKITVKTFCSCCLDLLNFVTALSCELFINLYYFFFLPIQFTQEMKTFKNLQAPVLNYFWEQEGE